MLEMKLLFVIQLVIWDLWLIKKNLWSEYLNVFYTFSKAIVNIEIIILLKTDLVPYAFIIYSSLFLF